MSKLTPEQIAERRARIEASPRYKLMRAQSKLQSAKRKLEGLDYKNHKYAEYAAVGKLDELGYTLADIYNLKQPIRDEINALEAEIAPLREQMRQEWLARKAAQEE